MSCTMRKGHQIHFDGLSLCTDGGRVIPAGYWGSRATRTEPRLRLTWKVTWRYGNW
jgi:hypothetical protein